MICTIAKKAIKSILLVILIAIFSASFSNSAQASGVEVRSENFILQGDISERNAKRIIKDLEIFRLSLFKMLQQELQPEKRPVKIYAFRSTKAFQSIVKNKTVAGMYRDLGDDAVFVLDGKGDFKSGDQSRKVALHEYVHHIIANYTNQRFPRWYNEGYANFLSNFVIKRNKFIIGAPDQNYANYLNYGGWMPMDALIGSVKNYPFTSGSELSSQRHIQSAFYAQSWLAVTFLQTNPEYARKSSEYLARVDRGENSLEAFQTTFGMTPDEFGKILRRFLKKDYFLQYPFPLTKEEKSPYMTSRKLDDAALRTSIIEAQLAFNKPF